MSTPHPFPTKALTLFAALLVAGTAQSAEAPPRLTVQGLTVLQKGETPVIVSSNGRYVATVALYDKWTGRYVLTPEDAAYSAGHIDPNRLKLKPADLAPVTVGEGPEVIVFADPLCPHCRKLFAQMSALAHRYTFRVVLLATLGEESRKLVARYDCADPEAAANAMVTGDDELLPPAKRVCRPEAVLRRGIAAYLIGVQTIPYLIAPDGRISVGAPENLSRWLEAGS